MHLCFTDGDPESDGLMPKKQRRHRFLGEVSCNTREHSARLRQHMSEKRSFLRL